ncbi:chromate transporter [Nitrobacter sp. JJSN]|uniref:chromate transporter n=1 Tax=Nitrobacter sp. JJSN TaxID=3453033 RepID=UPI003F76430A
MPESDHAPVAAPSVAKIGSVFARYANLTLGGGSATTAVIHREIVEKRRWVDDPKFTLSFALARLTPGTNLLAFCTAIGWLLGRLPGAIVALLAASVPCTLLVVLITAVFSQWQDNTLVQAALRGAVAAAVAITVKTCWTIAHPIYKPGARARVITVAAVAFALDVVLHISPIEVLLLAAVVGFFLPEHQA